MRLATVVCLLAAGLAPALPPNYEDAPLRAITFADAREGWAVGDDGVIWHTIDAGTNWERQPSGTRASLRAVQFLTPYTGFVVGRTELPNRAGSAGVLLSTTDGGVTWTEVTSTLLPGLNAVQFFDDKRGIVAGDGSDSFPSGVFRTDDGGRSWTMLKGPRATTWGAIWQDKSGGMSLFGPDASATITGDTVETRNYTASDARMPWRPYDRLRPDDGLGWSYSGGQRPVVGELGTIYGPAPDGKTWQIQRAGGQRAGVLFAYERAKDVPLSAVAALAADGYLCAAVASNTGDGFRSSDAPGPAADARFLLPAAIRTAGGAGATECPGLHSGYRLEVAMRKMIPITNDDHLTPDGKHDETQRVNALRMAIEFWKPDVVVTDIPTAGKLPVAKVYTLAAGPGDGVVSLNLTAYVPELGGSPRDVAEPAALLFGPTPQPDALHFKLVGGTMADAKGHTSLMQGIDLAEGGTARRKKPAPADADRERVAVVRRELEKQLAAPPTAESVAAAVARLKTLPEADAARAGTMLGFRLAHAGHWTAARELFACVATDYPAYPDAVEAIRWLVRFHTSGEARRRVELGHFPLMSQTGWVEEPTDPVRQASHTAELTPTPKLRFKTTDAAHAWVKVAADLDPKLRAFGAAYARDPANALCVGSANRLLGLPVRASDRYAALVGTVAEPWGGRLGDELRLLGKPGDFPKGPEIACRFVRVKPFLDGKLDDACWKDADKVEIADGTARLVCDDQFLYVGVECRGAATGEKLPRDSDLTGRDRVELMLDVDRDYTTGYRLAVDSAGSVADDCWGDRTWNPKLFVATNRTNDGWAVELAIPLSELTGTKPSPGQPWAAGVARRKAGEAEPAALGLLRFVAGK